MDLDQFGGRTDDDLFADDIEPLPYEGDVDIPADTTTTEPEHAVTPQPPAPDVTPASSPKPAAPKGLSNSIHNRPDRSHASKNLQSFNQNQAISTALNTSQTAPPPSLPQNGLALKSQIQRTNNSASVSSEARANSGGVPRPKLSKAESDKIMEQRRLDAAKKTQRYERQKNDEEQHAIAYAKGQREALKRKEAARREEPAKDEDVRKQGEVLKRKQEEAARRKAAMGEKNKYEADREQNKGRKGMRALWDQGKADLDPADVFTKGANGGVKGSTTSGLGGSRFASEGDNHGSSYGASTGRQHGRRDHGRKLFEPEDRQGSTENDHQALPAPAPRTTATQKPKAAEDFPALPSSGPAPTNTLTSPTWVKPVGDWAEDVEG
ncbi:hypothetical protein QBC40DRAFT_278672 [Triangularia verruculosa]|uniref:Uncharacterized protein n=1 Tax=Triangularia verruculosa TaxID=2587418 RepID=A0AAN7AU37_9PEZI|nr:hypothetical protein QBC40DRAFT_278672 [Triangularia verruculosa]